MIILIIWKRGYVLANVNAVIFLAIFDAFLITYLSTCCIIIAGNELNAIDYDHKHTLIFFFIFCLIGEAVENEALTNCIYALIDNVL